MRACRHPLAAWGSVPADALAIWLEETALYDTVAASPPASSRNTCAPQALLAFALREAGGALREPKQACAAAACILRACEGAVGAGLAVPQDALAALLQALAPPTGLAPQVPHKSSPWGIRLSSAAEEQQPFPPGASCKSPEHPIVSSRASGGSDAWAAADKPAGTCSVLVRRQLVRGSINTHVAPASRCA